MNQSANPLAQLPAGSSVWAGCATPPCWYLKAEGSQELPTATTAGESIPGGWDNLYLWEHNTHRNTLSIVPAGGNRAAPAVTLHTGARGCQPAPALCLYNTTIQQLLHAPGSPDLLEGKYIDIGEPKFSAARACTQCHCWALERTGTGI